MSLSTRSYSKESRSSSYYSRSASYHHSNTNNNLNTLARSQTLTDSRPLSVRLIEREPIWSWNWDIDDPFWYDRVRWRLNWPFVRPFPICYRTWDSSTTTSRTIPIQYTPSSTSHRAISYKKTNANESTSNFVKHDESSMIRENRISLDDYPLKQDRPSRRRTSMTILVQRPYIDQTEVPFYRQTLPTPTYPPSARFDYY